MATEVREVVAFARPQELPGVEVLKAQHSGRLWRVFHETYAISSIVRLPYGEWVYRGKTLAQRAGHLSMMEPGETHVSTKLATDADFRVLFIPADVLQPIAAELGISAAQPRLVTPQMVTPRLFADFARLHGSIDRGTTLERQTRFHHCMTLFLEHCTEQPPRVGRATLERDRIRRARDVIHAHFSEPIRLAELARTAGLSRFHLLRSFRAVFGVPPHAYQIQMRVERARMLLAGGSTVAEASAEVGFHDQSHLTRHFRRAYGVTPGNYRRSQ